MPNLFDLFLEFFFPSKEIDRLVREMDAGSFVRKARRAGELELRETKAIFDYKDRLVRHALWQLKYKKNKKLARLFAEIIYSILIEELGDLEILEGFKKPILIAVPLHKKRLRERGFNQVELVARDLALIDAGNSFEYGLGFLEKTKETESQTALKKEERLKNLKGAFRVKSGVDIKDRNIILLDDVVTTGTTIEEVRKILLEAGARSVYCLAVAH